MGGPCHANANSEDPDQAAHLRRLRHRLIRASSLRHWPLQAPDFHHAISKTLIILRACVGELSHRCPLYAAVLVHRTSVGQITVKCIDT